MGSYEIYERSSDEIIQDIVEVETPSPLTSSHSSDSNSSLWIGINELTTSDVLSRVRKIGEESSGEEAGDEEYSEAIDSERTINAERLKEESLQKQLEEENLNDLSDTDSTSLKSSPSSLKRRLQDLPSPCEAIKLADRVAALDRRIRRERDVYLQLQGLTDRIEEKDEAEVSSINESSSITNFFLENPSHSTHKDPRARRRANMCSSAPETLRQKNEPFEQRTVDVAATSFKNPLAKKYDERRPPKYLQPLEVPMREIIRCNAPPLCLTDKKIVDLLRRGSASAREEYLKKSAKAPTKPTGMIIKNLSSGSEEDCTNNWLIHGSSVAKFGPVASVIADSNYRSDRSEIGKRLSIPDEATFEESKIRQQIDDREPSESSDHPRSSRSAKTVRLSSRNSEAQPNEDTEVLDDLSSSRSSKLTKTSLQNSMAQLKSVLKDLDSHSRETRPLSVPKLDIGSQDYSQSTSLASGEDSTKRSLDVSALMRALSDVSIKQQDFVDRRTRPEICDSLVSGSTEPKSSAYTSVANGSRQSMISMENVELKETKNNCSKSLRDSRGSVSADKKIKFNDGNSKVRSKIPIVMDDTNDAVVTKTERREWQKNSRKTNIAEESDAPEEERKSKRIIARSPEEERKSKRIIARSPEEERKSKRVIARSSSPKKIPKCRSTNFIESNKCSLKQSKINSPEMKKSRKPKSPRPSRIEKIQDKSSSVATKNFKSLDSLMQNCEKFDKNPKVTNGSVVALSEPGTSRNGRVILRDHLSSRGTFGTRDILPRLFKDDPASSDDRFKYLQQGSKIPYIRRSSSGSSSTEREETEFKMKIMRPSATGFQSVDEAKIEAKFKIYEDTDEASPKSKFTFPIEEPKTTLNLSPRASKSRPEIHKADSKTTNVNGFLARKDSKSIISSPEDNPDCKALREDDEENSKNRQKLVESGDLSWADSSAELNQAMGSFSESPVEATSNANLSGARSCLISPRSITTKKKSCSSSSGSSPKIFSSRSSLGTGSSHSPRCRYNEDARLVCKNLATGSFEHFIGDDRRKFDAENIFSSSTVVKRLSYSELQNSNTGYDNSEEESSSGRKSFVQNQLETSSPEEPIEKPAMNSSQTNLAITGRSDSTVHQFRRAFDRAATRANISSSLSKLTRSPEETNNLGYRRQSQDRFPFTISESTSAKSSSKFKGEQAVRAASGNVTTEPSETAYKLRLHPSLLRLAGSGIEATAEEIIRAASVDPTIRVEGGNFVEKFLRRFSTKLRRKSGKQEDESGSRTTKVLYENKECRAGSADESYRSTSAEKPGRRFNRDGLWVEGLRDDSRPESEEETNQKNDKVQFPDMNEQETIDRYTIFLSKRQRHRRQFSRHGFGPETPMNSLIIDEDSDTDPDCFCTKICRFFIGGNSHSRHRSTLFLRARRSKLRRRF